jgi:hypothetical protein
VEEATLNVDVSPLLRSYDVEPGIERIEKREEFLKRFSPALDSKLRQIGVIDQNRRKLLSRQRYGTLRSWAILPVV